MNDLFKDKAAEWDSRPIPAQISEGVYGALCREADLDAATTVMDFGAGTGLVGSKVAAHVEHILAVDISPAMLEQLAQKPELQGKVEIFCQNILEEPLGREVDLIVSAMAMHHVEDTEALFRAFAEHLSPGGKIALADLDKEDGSFHPADIEGVFHTGFERDALARIVERAGFSVPRFVTACEVHKDERSYPIFLLTATKAG